MAQAPEFKYAPMFQVGEDTTEYYHLTSEHVSLGNFEGKEILKVTPEALTMLIERAFTDVNFMLRRSHNECVAKILKDPEASDNDKYVALTMLRNAEISAKGILVIGVNCYRHLSVFGIIFFPVNHQKYHRNDMKLLY